MLDLAGKRVLVLGLGISGLSAARFCAQRGASVLAADERPAAARVRRRPASPIRWDGSAVRSPRSSCVTVTGSGGLALCAAAPATADASHAPVTAAQSGSLVVIPMPDALDN